jgi:hypothetical protein
MDHSPAARVAVASDVKSAHPAQTKVGEPAVADGKKADSVAGGEPADKAVEDES